MGLVKRSSRRFHDSNVKLGECIDETALHDGVRMGQGRVFSPTFDVDGMQWGGCGQCTREEDQEREQQNHFGDGQQWLGTNLVAILCGICS